jgi:hypothetical protein
MASKMATVEPCHSRGHNARRHAGYKGKREEYRDGGRDRAYVSRAHLRYAVRSLTVAVL